MHLMILLRENFLVTSWQRTIYPYGRVYMRKSVQNVWNCEKNISEIIMRLWKSLRSPCIHQIWTRLAFLYFPKIITYPVYHHFGISFFHAPFVSKTLLTYCCLVKTLKSFTLIDIYSCSILVVLRHYQWSSQDLEIQHISCFLYFFY